MLISPLLASHPLISSPSFFYFSLCIFSPIHVSLPPINPCYDLHCRSLSPFPAPHSSPVLYFSLSIPVTFSPPPAVQMSPPLPPSLPLPLLHRIPPSLPPSLVRAHSGWRRPTQSSQGAEGLSTPTQALRHGTQRNRDRGERTDGRRTHWLPVL